VAAKAFTTIFDPNFQFLRQRTNPSLGGEFPVSLFIFKFRHSLFFLLLLFFTLGIAFEFDIRFGNQNLAAFVKAASAAGAMRLDWRQALRTSTWS